jgi:glycosyltransferase involved in cell wall biosynthesis
LTGAAVRDDALVTALMPLKNYERDFLFKALRSLTAQSSPDWRLLVIVEHEDRVTFERLLHAELAHARARLIVNEGRKLAGAMNTGMRRAETPFVAILLADDMWAPNAIEVLTSRIRLHPDADFFHSSRVFIDENDRPISSVHSSRESFELEDFLVSSPVKHLLCWRRELALSFGGMDESLNNVGPDDYDFPWSMAEHGARFHAIAEALYLYRDHRDAERLTTHLPLSVHLRELRRILTKHGASRDEMEARIVRARTSYLRQCLYRNRADKWLKELIGHEARRGWRETYR